MVSSGISPEQYARIAANRVDALRRQELKNRVITSTDLHATPTKVMKSEAASSSGRRLDCFNTPEKLALKDAKFSFADRHRFEDGGGGTKILTSSQLDRIASQRTAAVLRSAIAMKKC